MPSSQTKPQHEPKLRLEPLLHVLITLLVVSGLLFIARAQEERVNLDDLRSGELLFYTDTPGSYLPASRVSSQVNMQITGMVARVTLSQQFQNTGEGWTEAIYVFPLPEDAAVDSLKMHIGERVIVGEIKREDEARAVYEEAKEAGQQTSLVEQERPNMFTTSVANIGPGETIIIEISYLETLRYDSGTFSLRFPLAITPRYIPGQPLIEESEKTYKPSATGWAANTDQVPDAKSITPPYLESGVGNTVTIHAVIDAGFKLASLESRYHQTTMSEKEGIYSLELTAEVPADKDFELVWTPEVGAEPGAAVFAETWESESYALLMLMPPALSNTSLPAPAREVILIIDTSGSMEGTSIVQAKEAVQLALSRLKPADRFNVIEFNDAASSLFRTPREANAANLRLAERFVNQLRADGGTEMRSALELAFQTQAAEGYLGQVVFMTDGSVGNEAELFALIERELGSHRLFTVGIGSAPNSYFMRKAAEFGRGTYTFISDLGETGEKMSELFVKLEQPVLTGLELKLPAGSDVYPKTVPDLYLGEPVLVSVKLSAQGGEAVLSGNLNGQAWTRRLSLSNPGSQNGISQLWARAKIEELNDELIRGGNWEMLEEDITQLALKHHLVTDYTSLVAVDKTPVRPANEILETESIPQNLPAGQSYEAIFGEADAMAAPLAPAPAMMMKTNQAVGFADTATLAPLNLIIGLITLLLACLLLIQLSRDRMRA